MYHQGAKVKGKHYATPMQVPHRLPPQKVLDSNQFNAKQEAYRMAQANRNSPWARRYLKQCGRTF